jgi:two-component system invasion response regulator UvrY
MVAATHTQKLSVLIVDDHLLLRQGLKQVLSHEFRDLAFGEAKTSAEAIAQIHLQPWRLVILDIGLPDSDGFVVLQEVRARRPETAVLILSMHADSLYAARSLRLGAAGYVSKSSGRATLLKAVNPTFALRGTLFFVFIADTPEVCTTGPSGSPPVKWSPS